MVAGVVTVTVQVEQIGARADEGAQRHHQLFANRVDGRVGHLREVLLEVTRQRFAAVGQHRRRHIGAHRADGFGPTGQHRQEEKLQIFLGVTECLLGLQQGVGVWRRGDA